MIDKASFKTPAKGLSVKAPTTFFGDNDEVVLPLPLTSLVAFRDHPFQVKEDGDMAELVESIDNYGVATAIIVREIQDDRYEIIAGHRRVHASRLLGLTEIPAIIKDLDDDDAVLFMVDTNIQRQSLLFSEKAFAYKMKLEAAKRKVGRPSRVESKSGSVPMGQNLTSREMLAQNSSDSSVQIQRYIRLTHLNPDLLDFTDEKKLVFRAAVELSYLAPEQQEMLFSCIDEEKTFPSIDQATKIRKFATEGQLTRAVVTAILTEGKPKNAKVTLKLDMADYFPEKTSKAEMETVVLDLLKQWKANQGK